MEVAAMSGVARIDTVDIDPTVYEIAQDHFFQAPLDEKIIFHPYSARFVVNQMIKEGKDYDLIFLDAYNGKSLPDELVTVEFFDDIQQLLADDGLLVANLILDSRLETDFAHHALATMGRVF